MSIVWGVVVAAIGAVFIFWGTTRSEFPLYRLFVARSRVMWGDGDRVHSFYQVAGGLMIIFGAVMAVTG
mgnify:CR=1 FL=1